MHGALVSQSTRTTMRLHAGGVTAAPPEVVCSLRIGHITAEFNNALITHQSYMHDGSLYERT